jgi:hypothetical protein
VLIEKDLPSDSPLSFALPDGSLVLVKAGDARSGTKLQVREVLNVEKQIGGLTVPDKVWDLAVSGRLLNDIKVVYPVPPAPPGSPTPIAGMLDRTTGKWTRIMNATFDENNRRLEVPIGKSASIGRLQWDWSTAIDGAAKAASSLIGQADGTAPDCTSEDAVYSHFDIGVASVASVAWCAGIEQGHEVLRVRNGGRLPIAILSSGFALGDVRSGPYAYVDALAGELAGNQAWQLPAGKQVKVIAPGSELTMSYVRTSTPSEVRAEVDAYSQQVAALAVAAEVATSIFAGQGTPAHGLLEHDTPLRTSLFRNLTSAQCADTLGPIDQADRRPTALLTQYVGQLVTSCIGNDMRAELASASATTTPQSGSFVPNDDTDLPADFADQVSRAVATTVDSLTQRDGLQQLSKVVMEPRAATSAGPNGTPTTIDRTPTTTRSTAVDATTAPSTPTSATGPAPTTPGGGTTPTVPTTPASVPTTATTVVTTPPTTQPPATTTTLPVTTPTTDPVTTTTTTLDPGPTVTVVNTMNYPSAPNQVCTRGAGTATQPFTVPSDVTELDTVTISTTSSFTADVEIFRDEDGKRLSTRTLRANAAPGTAELFHLPVAPGSALTLVVSNVRGTADPSVAIDLTTDAVANLGTATISNSCSEVANAVFTRTALAMQILGR